MKGLVAVGAVLVVACAANAQSLTTLFASNNGGSVGGAVYFDVIVGPNALTITGYDTNVGELVTFGWEVYLTAPGVSYYGNEANPAAWTLVATGTGVGMGDDNPSPVTLDATFGLDANTLYGMALVLGPEAGHEYSNGPLGPYSNADLTLELGSATNVPFSGSPFYPRVWNGTIYYTPGPGALALLGLAGLVRRRRR
jgi:hypothetical protein